ncbi:MAG: hypothetical protein IPL61_13095 [Myxococcales bacterium]|nr:hypothetical protein [Myxococcales bacterium]
MTRPISRRVPHLLSLSLALTGACVAPPDPGDVAGLDAGEVPVDRRAACELPPSVVIEDGLLVFEGDIVLGREDELDALCAQSELRGIGLNPGLFNTNRWSNGYVPFEVASDLPQKDRVYEAVQEWNDKTTSIQLVEVNGLPDYVDHIRFRNHNDACLADLGRKGGEQYIRLSTGKSADQIVGMAINDQDKVYTWYDDGMVTVGTSGALEALTAQYAYTLPPGKTAADILDIGIEPSTQDVYTWYRDRTYSIGTSSALGAELPSAAFTLPGGLANYESWKVVGIDFNQAGAVYAWYHTSGSTWRTVGTAAALGASGQSVTHAGDYQGANVRGMAISSADWVYTWYSDQRVTAGSSRDLDANLDPYRYEVPGHCDRSAAVHEIGHALGLHHEQTRCDRDDYVRVFWGNIKDDKVHNFDKHCTGSFEYGDYDPYSIMHYSSHQFSKNESPTLLRHPPYGEAEGAIKIVASAIAANDHVYTWWSNGSVTSGSSTTLEAHRSRYAFTLPPPRFDPTQPYFYYFYTPASIVGIAIASNDHVYTFYANGTVSEGTTEDLDAYTAPSVFTSPLSPMAIVDVGIANNGNVYAWYTTGQASIGHSDNLSAVHGLYTSVPHPSYTMSDVRGVDINNDDVIYAWYDDGHLSRGGSDDLNSVSHGRTAFQGRGLAPIPGDILSNGDIAIIEFMY